MPASSPRGWRRARDHACRSPAPSSRATGLPHARSRRRGRSWPWGATGSAARHRRWSGPPARPRGGGRRRETLPEDRLPRVPAGSSTASEQEAAVWRERLRQQEVVRVSRGRARRVARAAAAGRLRFRGARARRRRGRPRRGLGDLRRPRGAGTAASGGRSWMPPVRALAIRGFAEAVLWVFEANAPARGFYERMGWSTRRRVEAATRSAASARSSSAIGAGWA